MSIISCFSYKLYFTCSAIAAFTFTRVMSTSTDTRVRVIHKFTCKLRTPIGVVLINTSSVRVRFAVVLFLFFAGTLTNYVLKLQNFCEICYSRSLAVIPTRV